MTQLRAHVLGRVCYSQRAGQHEGFGNIKARHEWVVVEVEGKLLEARFVYFIIYLS